MTDALNSWAAPMGAGVGVHTCYFTKQLVPDPDEEYGYVERNLCSCGELGHEITEEKVKRLQERGERARNGPPHRAVLNDVRQREGVRRWDPMREPEAITISAVLVGSEDGGWTIASEQGEDGPNRRQQLEPSGGTGPVEGTDPLPVTPLDPPTPRLSDSDLFSRYVTDALEATMRELWAAERAGRDIWGSNPSVAAGRVLERYRLEYRLLNEVRRRARQAMGGRT